MILFLPNRHFYRKIQCLFPSKTKSKKSIPVNLLTTQLNFLDFSLNILFKVQNTFKSHRDRFSHFWFTYVFLVTVPLPPLWQPYLRDSAPQAHRQPFPRNWESFSKVLLKISIVSLEILKIMI